MKQIVSSLRLILIFGTMQRTQLLISVIALVALNPAHAATVLIDWSTAASVTNPAGDGKHWNSLGAPTTTSSFDLATTALIDSTGASSGISVAMFSATSNGTGAGFGGTGINGPAGADPFDEANAIVDGIYANNNAAGIATITFTGLAASTTYNISAIGGRASAGEDGVITVTTGTSASTTYDLSNTGTVLDFSVTSDASGEIVFDFSRSTGTGGLSATFNAMSITSIPEPSAALLGGLGALLLLRRRRS
jgi:MYXO-CTERM domain-containing protein